MGMDFVTRTLCIVVCLSLFSCLVFALCPASMGNATVLSRTRRQLLFPNVTLLQFNVGIGSASPVKTIFVNWAFQGNFNLPWNRTQIPFDILYSNSGYGGLSRRKRDGESTVESVEPYEEKYYKDDTMLYHVYKYAEEMLNGLGHNGSSCVHRTLCELGAAPLHSDDDQDLFQEIAAFIFNPSNGPIPSDPDEQKELQSFVDSFKYGDQTSTANCYQKYKDCSASLLDVLTKLEGSE